MVMGAEIALLVMGIFTLVRGQVNLGGGTVVHGGDARMLGMVMMAPLPVSLVLALSSAMLGLEGMTWFIEVGVLIACIALVYAWGGSMAKRQARADLDLE